MPVITVDGRPVELARKEFELLLALARRPDEVVTKRDLLGVSRPARRSPPWSRTAARNQR